ncbi:hypothetical protein ACHAWU_007330, partial [Discostella pseudostelligera]
MNNLPSNNYLSHQIHDHDERHPPHSSSTFAGSDTAAAAAASASGGDNGRGVTWQEMFQQLKDFHELKHRKIPPRLALWMNAQRRQYKMYGIGMKQPVGIITNRIRQLNSIGFEWDVVSNECVQPPLPPPPPPPSSRGQGESLLNRHCNNGTVHLSTTTHSTRIKTKWTEQEDDRILRLQMQWGDQWKKIATELHSGRTENDIKNRWLTLDRLRRRQLEMDFESTDNEGGRCMEMDVMSDDEVAPEEEDDDGRDNNDNDVEQNNENDLDEMMPSSEFIVVRERTDHVERIVRDALERERRPRRALKSTTVTAPKKSSKRIRKPSRRVQESYLTIESNSTSSCNNSTGEEHGMQLDDLASGHTSRRNGKSPHGGNNPIQGSHNSEAVSKSTKEQFPEILYRMVNTCSETEPHIIEWVSDGTAFQVKDVNLLPAVLHRYFRHKNYVSLNRMLHMYGFQRQTSGKQVVDVFHHPHFTRWSSRDSLLAFVTKSEEASKHGQESKSNKDNGDVSSYCTTGKTASLKSSKVKLGKGCGKGFSTELPKTNLSRHRVQPEIDVADRNAHTVTQNDVILSLKSRKYKQVMFAQFKELGLKDGTEDIALLKRIAGEILDTFKRGMGATGRFYRKVRGARPANGQPPYELQNDAETLFRITSDLRRRMESSNYWLDMAPETQDFEVDRCGTISVTECQPRTIQPKTSTKRSAKEMKSPELFIHPNHNSMDDDTYFKANGNVDDDKDEADVKSEGEVKSKSSDAGDSTLNPCMCKKSKCLKLYCECFNKEQYCSGCFCVDCNNTPQHDAKRAKVIAHIKQRNPDAFTQKIKTSIECKCKRTACLKKYCDCFLHGVYCGDTCKCIICENVEPKQRGRTKSELIFDVPTEKELNRSNPLSSIASKPQSATMRPAQKAGVASTLKSTTVTPPPKCQPRDGDIILSLNNDEYKEIMFSKFRTIGIRMGTDENAMLDVVKNELLSLFKQKLGKDGRLLKADRHRRDLWVADDDEALH